MVEWLQLLRFHFVSKSLIMPCGSIQRWGPCCLRCCRLGRPLGFLTFSLMALRRDPIYQYFSKGFRGQPSRLEVRDSRSSMPCWASIWPLPCPCFL